MILIIYDNCYWHKYKVNSSRLRKSQHFSSQLWQAQHPHLSPLFLLTVCTDHRQALGGHLAVTVHFPSSPSGGRNALISVFLACGLLFLVGCPQQEREPVITLALKYTMVPMPILKWR
jgi:hypothetical protein